MDWEATLDDATLPRVPLPAVIELPGATRTVQVNHCKMPACPNYGVPARTEHGKPGPSADRDMHYKLHSTSKGQIPAVRCKECLDNPPVKSNAAIAEEVSRLADESGVWHLEERMGCSKQECPNRDRFIAFHPESYRKRGKTPSGEGRYYECRKCGRRTLASDPARIHGEARRHAADVLGRIANKSPVRGTVRGTGLKSTGRYYNIVDFLHRRCRTYSGRFDRAMIDGRLRLPDDMNLQTDAQIYRLNWVSRLDRRNVELSSYCTVHADTQYILGMHTNFDGRVDPFTINAEAARSGDLDMPEAFRRYAQYWLAGDELRAGRAMFKRRNEKSRIDLLRQIEELYRAAESREDVENVELQGLNDNYVTPELSRGLQVHMPYTAYGHWFLLHRILPGAGVKKVQANMDIDSMGRAGFLSAFVDEVKRGDAHGFFVKYTKFQTIDERRELLAQSRHARAVFKRDLPEDIRDDEQEVSRLMMKPRIDARIKMGKWDDEWVGHPFATLNEPRKAMSWLTPNLSIDEDRIIDMFLRAGLSRIDNTFLKTRRLFNALERPVGTSSGHNTVWHGYAPYNPAMLEKYVTIFRAVNNFVFVGDDKRTPAMRLGFAKAPLRFEDLVWPGERVPQPKRARRKGKPLRVGRTPQGRKREAV